MRAKKAKKRIISPDPRYNSEQLQRFINHIMLHGKKGVAMSIVYDALEQAAERVQAEPLDVFQKALANVAPSVEVRSRRVGGANYQVPTPVRADRRDMLSMRWIIEAARKRSGTDMSKRLSQELIDAYNGEGEAMKLRNNVHKMAEANRAFSHFKW